MKVISWVRIFCVFLVAVSGLSTQPVFGLELSCLRGSKYVCVVPFGFVYARGNELIGRYIRVSGYLYANGTDAALFPDQTPMQYGVLEAALMVSLESEDLMSRLTQLNGKYVTVVGRYERQDASTRYFGVIDVRQMPVLVPIVAPYRPLNGS